MIRVKFNAKAFKETALTAHKTFLDAAITNFTYIGEEFIGNARKSDDYTDRTGNLRSSIGYLILYNGTVIREAFEQADKGTDRATGERSGLAFAKALAGKYSTGLALIVVAGMEYAGYVEETGRDVLSASAVYLERDLRAAVRRIKTKMKKR